jgi:hypothetical protein
LLITDITEQKKLEAKEMKKEAQAKQAKMDEAAEQVANLALVQTIVGTPQLSPGEGVSMGKENGNHDKE